MNFSLVRPWPSRISQITRAMYLTLPSYHSKCGQNQLYHGNLCLCRLSKDRKLRLVLEISADRKVVYIPAILAITSELIYMSAPSHTNWPLPFICAYFIVMFSLQHNTLRHKELMNFLGMLTDTLKHLSMDSDNAHLCNYPGRVHGFSFVRWYQFNGL